MALIQGQTPSGADSIDARVHTALQRPARKGPSAKRGRQGPSRLLMVLMGLGAITLLAGFVMTVVNQSPLPACRRNTAWHRLLLLRLQQLPRLLRSR